MLRAILDRSMCRLSGLILTMISLALIDKVEVAAISGIHVVSQFDIGVKVLLTILVKLLRNEAFNNREIAFSLYHLLNRLAWRWTLRISQEQAFGIKPVLL